MAGRDRRLGRWLGAQPRWVLAVLALLFVAGTVRFFAATRKDGSPEIRIGVDGRYHWAYLTSLVLDRDLDFTNQYADPESGNYYGYGRTPTGRFANPFPVGPALAWAPAFIVAHGVATIAAPAHAASGNSHLHQQLTLYASFLFTFVAGLFVYAVVRRRYGPGAAVAGAVVAVAAGPLLQYSINQPSYAHAPSALAVAALIWAWDSGRPKGGAARSLASWLALGALAGAAALMRAQNLVFAIPLVAEGVVAVVWAARRAAGRSSMGGAGADADGVGADGAGGGGADPDGVGAGGAGGAGMDAGGAGAGGAGAGGAGAGGGGGRRAAGWLAVLGAAARAAVPPILGALLALAVFAPQMIVWKLIYGQFIGVPQGEGYMRWSRPLWAETLFSSRNGLFPYAPLWALGLLGLIGTARKDRGLVLALVVTLGFSAYLNGASSDWSGGGAFGGRRYDGLLVHVALGFAAVVSWLVAAVERRPRAAAGVAVAAVVVAGGTCNYLLSDDYRKGRLPPSQAKDTLATYDAVLMRAGRAIWQGGNPLSWPGAWAFAWRTGAPPSRYDEVVGTFFLTDFRLEAYRKRSTDKPRDELTFAAGGHTKYLVRGFGEPRGEPKARVRPVIGPRARFLVPLNHGGGVGFRLVGRSVAATRVAVRWNGKSVAEVAVAAGAPIELAFTLGPDQLARGVNVVELHHDGVAAGQEGAEYARLAMEER